MPPPKTHIAHSLAKLKARIASVFSGRNILQPASKNGPVRAFGLTETKPLRTLKIVMALITVIEV
eukprot:scaffold764_cov240-Chaetoceros_neogracile.AAC.10